MVKALKMGRQRAAIPPASRSRGAPGRVMMSGREQRETAELLRYAQELLSVQGKDGAINDDDRRLLVTAER